MTLDQTIRIVQVSFPQVYLACHTRHQRRRSTQQRLSQRDSSILAHLDERHPTAFADLATHLGVARSTLSEALKRLRALGFVVPSGDSARNRAVLLSATGAAAIRDTSVLETERLRAALTALPPRGRSIVARGMQTLADACRRHVERSPTADRS